tara:strand:+ start:685 stop:1590 length:906 start_codon:yes stop_codon:yes gene_type:complete
MLGIARGLTRKALGASRKARKSKGKKAADLMTPSSVAKPMSQGESKLKGTGTPTSGDIPAYRVTVANQNKKGKNLTKTMKDLEAAKKKLKVYEEKRDSLKGIDKTKFIAKKSKQITKDKENIKLLKSKIKNMKDRDIVPKMGGGKVIKKDVGGKIERTETPEQRHLRNRKKLSTNQEKELNKRLRAIGIGRKSGNISGTLRPGLRAAGKSADKRESKVDRSGQKRAAKTIAKTGMKASPMAGISEVLFGDYELPKSKKKRKPSMEGDMIDLKGGGKIKGYKKGGPITYRMSGGQVVDNSYD